jgi:endonuclease YncB( thermonuclease family)
LSAISRIGSKMKFRLQAFGSDHPTANIVARALFVLLVLSPLTHPIHASAWQGKVVGVSDGDTITVMHDGKGEKIRLYGIDCPEKDQDYGQKAKQFTSNMVFGKTVDVKPIDQDRYGRTVGIVVFDGVNLNVELIRSGQVCGPYLICSLRGIFLTTGGVVGR